MTDSSYSILKRFLCLPFGVQWRCLVVRAPRLAPAWTTRFISSAPHPFSIELPSRGAHRIRILIFLPSEEIDKEEAESSGLANGLPVHLDFHGGDFFMGSCIEQAPFCAFLARERGLVAISVDYRLGPLHQFPSAVEDCEDVLAAILDADAKTKAGKKLREAIAHKLNHRQREHLSARILDVDRLSISGFSSGGNLALNLVLNIETKELKWPSLLSKDGSKIPLILGYPNFDSRTPPHERDPPPNMPDPKEDPKSFGSMISKILGPTYIATYQRSHLRASPGLADIGSCLSSRVEILLILPEYDTLWEQSNEWVAKMKEAGREKCLHVKRYEGIKHGFVQFPNTFLSGFEKEEKSNFYDTVLQFLSDVGYD